MTDTAVESRPRTKNVPRGKLNELAQKWAEKENRLVRGKFKIYECPGGTQKIVMQKYDKVFSEVMVDGEEYEVPVWVADYLNGIDRSAQALNGHINSCRYIKNSLILDPKTHQPVQGNGQSVERYGFISTDFGFKE